MALDGTHTVGSSGHVSDHNLIDQTLADHATQIAAKLDTATAASTYATWGAMVFNVKNPAYGAKGDGTTNDTTAILNAVAAAAANGGGIVYLPAGTYLISSTIVVNGSNITVAGDGIRATVITTASASLTSLQFTNGTATGARDLRITKSITSPGTGTGIDFSVTSDAAFIERVQVEKHGVGVLLGAAALSRFNNSVVQWNSSYGVQITNASAGGAAQWYLFGVLSQGNTGDGFRIASGLGKGTMSVGKIQNCYSYANSGRGLIAVAASSSDPIASMRISGSFFGQDGSDEIYLDTYGTAHEISQTFVELCGTQTTGPGIFAGSGLTTTAAQSNTGSGITLTANNTGVDITGCQSVSNSLDGLYSTASSLLVSSSLFFNNGLAGTSGRGNGIRVDSGTAQIIGNRMTNTSATYQQYGAMFGTTDVLFALNDLRGNALVGTSGSVPAVNDNNRT